VALVKAFYQARPLETDPVSSLRQKKKGVGLPNPFDEEITNDWAVNGR
jgi:hypothetical protein